MSQDEIQKVIFENADKFINLANELSQSDKSGAVGAALRFAAARYSAFEASMQSKNLEHDKEDQIKLFADEFIRMLRINVGDYVEVQKKSK